MASDLAIDLLENFLHFNPKKRLTASQALEHPYFQEKPIACENKKLIKDLIERGKEYHVHSLENLNKKKEKESFKSWRKSKDPKTSHPK